MEEDIARLSVGGGVEELDTTTEKKGMMREMEDGNVGKVPGST